MLPARLQRLVTKQGCKLRAAPKREPAHELRVHVVSLSRPWLPDAMIGLGPHGGDVVDDLPQPPPTTRRKQAAATLVDVRGVHQRPRGIELQLIARAVSDPHGSRAPIPAEVV